MWKHLADEIEKDFSVKFTYLQVETDIKTVRKRKKIILTRLNRIFLTSRNRISLKFRFSGFQNIE